MLNSMVARFGFAIVSSCLLLVPSVGQTPSWPFTTPKKAAVPSIPGVTNPIDAFLLQKLQAKGLGFAPVADRRTLIRRASFDLTGLPPAPEEVDAFLSDKAPGAWERLIDRLLASPRYGERWGRHWLDIVRFGETDGGEHNHERWNSWPYRDYVIDAFNKDVPYNEFIRTQIAGDVLFPDDRSKLAATGFLVAGPWDQVTAELTKDPILKKTARMDELDDMVTTCCASFLALTVNCARCHDHKFDPIPTRDYYRLTAVFSGAGFGERSIATPDEIKKYDEQARPLKNELGKIENELENIEDPVTTKLLLAKYLAVDQARKPGQQRMALNPIYNRSVWAPVTAQYWRLAILGSRGKPALSHFELRPAKALKEDWKSPEAGSPDKPVYLSFDLEKPKPVSEMAWWTDQKTGHDGGAIQVFRMEYSSDGKTWKEVATNLDHINRLEEDLPRVTNEEVDAQLSPETKAKRAQLVARQGQLNKQLGAITAPPRLYACRPIGKPEAAFVLERGSPAKPKEAVIPGALETVGQLPSLFNLPGDATDGQRRVALADWIASPKNPLTARVIANRVWYYHFGNGIVNTPSDFGRNGDKPSHPELLDWLACAFTEQVFPTQQEGRKAGKQENDKTLPAFQDSSIPAKSLNVGCGWQLKRLHKLIMTSRAYMQSDAPNAKAHSVDAGNRLLWHMPLKRMDAEMLRDSILQVTGNLDLRQGGPSFQLHSKGDRGSYIYHALDNDGPAVWRRAVYRFTVRGGDKTLLENFDCPDPSVATPQRQISNTPVQALTLMNNAFVIRQAELLAKRVQGEEKTPEAQIRRAYLLALGRTPSAKEAEIALKVANQAGLGTVCRSLLNANEFVYVP